jgi:hypothetical protein
MGRVKAWLMEQEERGWWSTPEKYVCVECFEEEYLQEFVKENAEALKCDYCDSTAEELPGRRAAPIGHCADSRFAGIPSKAGSRSARNRETLLSPCVLEEWIAARRQLAVTQPK